MNELIDKVDNLINVIDNTEQVMDIKSLNEEVMKDEKLLSLIKKYQETQDDKLKKEIINNELFSHYKEKETDLNILILEINSKLKEISNKGKCC